MKIINKKIIIEASVLMISLMISASIINLTIPNVKAGGPPTDIIFELDGNLTDDIGGGLDWESLYNYYEKGIGPDPNTTIAPGVVKAFVWVNDSREAENELVYFGDNKDIYDIPNLEWQEKKAIINAY